MLHIEQRAIVTGETPEHVRARQVRIDKQYKLDSDARRAELEKRFGKGVPMRDLSKSTE